MEVAVPVHLSQPRNTFVIRFWLEPADPVAIQNGVSLPPFVPRWRAHIFHLQSDKGTYLNDAHELLAFIRRYTAPLESHI